MRVKTLNTTPRRLLRRAAAGSVVLAAALTIPVATAGAAAAQVPQEADAQFTCFVNSNNVNFRSGPGPGYPSLGQVHQGQGLEHITTEWDGVNYWNQGNLWGGPSGVWIRSDYVDC